jgi:hypothetical protein
LKLGAIFDNIRVNDTTRVLDFPQTCYTDQTFMKAHLKINRTKFNKIPRKLAQLESA